MQNKVFNGVKIVAGCFREGAYSKSCASCGSEEIGSCVYSYLSELSSGPKHLVCYSDPCGGQNRNIYMLCLWLHIVDNPAFSYEVIDQKFMVSGHSYLPNDRDFGIIESAKRRSQHIYVPHD